MVWENLREDLIQIQMVAETSADVFRQLGRPLMEKGYCKATYVDALIEREKEYPTGLAIGSYGVAIPHTDKTHVINGTIAIATLKNPVTFIEMGADEAVPVKVVFMLAVDGKQDHIDLLQAVLAVFQDVNVLERLMEAKEAKEIIEIIKNKEKKQ